MPSCQGSRFRMEDCGRRWRRPRHATARALPIRVDEDQSLRVRNGSPFGQRRCEPAAEPMAVDARLGGSPRPTCTEGIRMRQESVELATREAAPEKFSWQIASASRVILSNYENTRSDTGFPRLIRCNAGRGIGREQPAAETRGSRLPACGRRHSAAESAFLHLAA